MRKGTRIFGMFIVLVAVSTGICSADIDDAKKGRILSVIEDTLNQKTIQSGTLDLYDESGKKVRNLRLIEKNETISEGQGAYLLVFDYRDIRAGDIVKVEFKVIKDGEDLSVAGIRIKDVQNLQNKELAEEKEYTGEEIQAFMREYIQKQTQFTDGKLMMFDEENQKMRNLELKELQSEVRRMGIFYSSSSRFVDADSGDILVIDISVENSKGKLKIQALRIRDVKKGS